MFRLDFFDIYAGKISQTDIFQRKIGFRNKTAFLRVFLGRITHFSGFQLGEKKGYRPKLSGQI